MMDPKSVVTKMAALLPHTLLLLTLISAAQASPPPQEVCRTLACDGTTVGTDVGGGYVAVGSYTKATGPS